MGSSNSSFVHLHNHTAHSLLDGLSRLDDACAAAERDGQPAIAITDHGNLSAAYKFTEIAAKHGVKPIIGIEFYMAIGDRMENNTLEVTREDDMGGTDVPDEKENPKKPTKTKRYEHLTVLARNETGWRNIVQLQNASHESFYSKPRIDFDLLAKHSEGLTILTGCVGGPVAGRIAQGDLVGAETNLRRLEEIADPGFLFVEVMEHGIELERRVMAGLVDLAKKSGLQTVATNDAHYVEASSHHAHDAWLCVNSKTTLDDPNRFQFNGTGFHIRTAAEMRGLFDGNTGTEQACNNSLLIAEMCDDRVIPANRLRLPKFDVPDNYESAATYLYARVVDGAKQRYGTPFTPELKARLRHEFDVISNQGLADYFLIVEDLINWARANGIRVGPGRGSAAGCVISYCLGIVNIDPLANGLLFERFLNPERVGMPDIDIDFDMAGQQRVFKYLADRWGADRVARIGTFQFARTKKALQDAARVMDESETGTALSALVPKGASGKPLTFAELAVENPATEPFRSLVASNPVAAEIANMAEQFEGVPSAETIHPCGVLICNEPLNGLVPTRVDRRKGHEKEHTIITQWDGRDVDTFGLMKLDALALESLDVVSACEDTIISRGLAPEGFDADNPPTDPNDPTVQKTWQLISSGNTAGVFQLEGEGITDLCVAVGADCIDDLSAIVALYRPGPLGEDMHTRYVERKNGREKVDYGIFTAGSPNAEAENAVIALVLAETYGVPVYQEQLMKLGEFVAGFDPVWTNKIRTAVSKKYRDLMLQVGEHFIAGAIQSVEAVGEEGEVGYVPAKIAFAEETAVRLWDAIKASGDYSFNKSHSYGYGTLAYNTAYLKANWPTPYGAAMLSVTNKSAKRHAILNSLHREGIKVLAPDVNLSMERTGIDDNDSVLLGLAEIKDVGTNARWIVAEREARGPFKDLAGFVNRVLVPKDKDGVDPTAALSTNVVEALIDSGALDGFGNGRLGLVMAARACKDDKTYPAIAAEWGPVERARRERDRLGLLISEHPLTIPDVLEAPSELAIRRDSTNVPEVLSVIGFGASSGESGAPNLVRRCVLASWAERPYAGGRLASLVLEGPDGAMEGVMWNDDLTRLLKRGPAPAEGSVVDIEARSKERVVYVSIADGSIINNIDDVADMDDVRADVQVSLTVQALAAAGEMGRIDRPHRARLPFTSRLSAPRTPAPERPVAAEPKPVTPEPEPVAPEQTQPAPPTRPETHIEKTQPHPPQAAPETQPAPPTRPPSDIRDTDEDDEDDRAAASAQLSLNLLLHSDHQFTEHPKLSVEKSSAPHA